MTWISFTAISWAKKLTIQSSHFKCFGYNNTPDIATISCHPKGAATSGDHCSLTSQRLRDFIAWKDTTCAQQHCYTDHRVESYCTTKFKIANSIRYVCRVELPAYAEVKSHLHIRSSTVINFVTAPFDVSVDPQRGSCKNASFFTFQVRVSVDLLRPFWGLFEIEQYAHHRQVVRWFFNLSMVSACSLRRGLGAGY